MINDNWTCIPGRVCGGARMMQDAKEKIERLTAEGTLKDAVIQAARNCVSEGEGCMRKRTTMYLQSALVQLDAVSSRETPPKPECPPNLITELTELADLAETEGEHVHLHELIGLAERLTADLAEAKEEVYRRDCDIEGYQHRDEEIIVALGSLGISPSEIVSKVGALSAEVRKLKRVFEAAEAVTTQYQAIGFDTRDHEDRDLMDTLAAAVDTPTNGVCQIAQNVWRESVGAAVTAHSTDHHASASLCLTIAIVLCIVSLSTTN